MSGGLHSPTVDPADRTLRGLRGASFGALVMLVVQSGLGMWVNLFGRIPADDHGKGFLAAIGAALTNGPLGLTLHAALGMALLVTGVSAIVRAILVHRTVWIVLTCLALVALGLAAVNGARFVGDGSNGASFAMALATGAAGLCYTIILFLATPSPQ